MRSGRLTWLILGGLLVGIAAGYFCHVHLPEHSSRFAELALLLPDAFLRLIKMIIAPLVFSTLVAGIAKMGDIATVGRIGGKTLAWFVLASLISLSLGLLVVGIFEPGKVLQLARPTSADGTGVPVEVLSLQGLVTHTIPTSFVDALARNEILQIVVFSLFFGTAITTLGGREESAAHVRGFVQSLEVVAHTMLIVTGYVMMLAPLAVFGAIASVVAREGLSVLHLYGLLVAEFYLGLGILWTVLVALGAIVVGPRVFRLVRDISAPVLVAFATASSEAAYAKTLEVLERWGISRRVAGFVLPMGYSFNLDGSMMYCAFGVMFIAQVYGIEIPVHQQILMVAILMLTSKGIAGVPRASLVVVAATLQQFGIPEAGLVLLLGIDQLLDMGRSATNVVGNSIATAVVAKWEREVHLPAEAAVGARKLPDVVRRTA